MTGSRLAILLVLTAAVSVVPAVAASPNANDTELTALPSIDPAQVCRPSVSRASTK